MRVSVIGATGVLGRQVVPLLKERGHSVSALARSEPRRRYFQRIGVNPILGDIFHLEALTQVAQNAEVVLHLATAVPRRNSSAAWSENDRIRREGTHNLIQAATENHVPRYIQQSITLLYGDNQGVVNENAPLNPTSFIQSALDMENLVGNCQLDWCILRGGIFYGPGTGTEQGWRRAARDGSLRVPGNGAGFLSLIHVSDMARAVVQAAEAAPPRSTFNVVDDEPVTYRELFDYIAAQEGIPVPEAGANAFLPSLRCSNDRIRTVLGWSPVFSTYRTGLAGSHEASA